MRQFLSSLLEIAEVIIVAVGAVFLIRSFLIQPFLVSGSSMVPNFSNGDYLLVDELTYRFRPPERGEVVVFRYPKDESVYFIKRVIGLPGERVQLKDGRITISDRNHPQGFVLTESYLPSGAATNGSIDVQLQDNQYFVLGDNRAYSFDSRSWGAVPNQDIVGLVQLQLWPPTSLRVLAAPQY